MNLSPASVTSERPIASGRDRDPVFSLRDVARVYGEAGSAMRAGIDGRLDTTTAIITHDADVARSAHRVFRFRDGRIESLIENADRIVPADLDW